MDCQWFTRVTLRAISVIAGGALVCLPLAASAEEQLHADHAVPQHTAMSHQLPSWAEKLKGQTIVEDSMAGKPERYRRVAGLNRRLKLDLRPVLAAARQRW